VNAYQDGETEEELNDFYKKFFCVEKKIVDLRTYFLKNKAYFLIVSKKYQNLIRNPT
jgi:hypothetical protein